MKNLLTFSFLLLVITFGVVKPAKAQDPESNPGTYMNAISTAEINMNKAYMAYISAAAHSSRKGKIEKLRNIAVDNIVICQNTLTYLPAYKGDNSLRLLSAWMRTISYWLFCTVNFFDTVAESIMLPSSFTS